MTEWRRSDVCVVVCQGVTSTQPEGDSVACDDSSRGAGCGGGSPGIVAAVVGTAGAAIPPAGSGASGPSIFAVIRTSCSPPRCVHCSGVPALLHAGVHCARADGAPREGGVCCPPPPRQETGVRHTFVLWLRPPAAGACRGYPRRLHRCVTATHVSRFVLCSTAMAATRRSRRCHSMPTTRKPG